MRLPCAMPAPFGARQGGCARGMLHGRGGEPTEDGVAVHETGGERGGARRDSASMLLFTLEKRAARVYKRRMATTVRTRFAPSPTGYLHIGGARTAQGAARVPNGFYLLGRNTRKGHATSVKRQSR